MEIQQDFKELFELLNKHSVEYIIVGAHALAFYGHPRFTGDIDVFVHISSDNAVAIIKTLDDFGFGSLKLAAKDFLEENMVVQLGVAPIRIDLITGISGVTWAEAWDGKTAGKYGDVPVYYLGKSEYITNKTAVGRYQDLADIEAIKGSTIK